MRLLLLLIPGMLMSLDTSIMLFGISHHTVDDMRDFNPGLGVKLSTDHNLLRANIIGGGFINSYNDNSYFIAPGIEFGKSFGLQLNIGYISGYDIPLEYRPITPLIGVYARSDSFSMHILGIEDGIAMYLEYRL